MNKGQFKLYTASAGSGKTYTLVKEFLILSLSSGNLSYKDILAVTFTNKAANEMKAKMLSYLDGFINGKPDENMKNDLIKALGIDENTLIERSEVLYDNILHNYSDFNISTIDSFIQQVSRGFAKELNLPMQYKVLIDDDDLLDGLIQCIDSQIGEDDKSLTEIMTEFMEFQLDEEKSLRIDAMLKDFATKLLKESAYKKGEILNISMQEFSGDEYQKIKEYLNNLYKKCKKEVLDDAKAIKDVEDEFGIVTTDYFKGKNGLQSILRKIDSDVNVKTSSLVGAIVKSVFDGEKNWFSTKGNKQAIADVNKSGVDIVGLYKKLVADHKKIHLVNIVRNNLYMYALRSVLLNVINQYTDETNKVHLSEFNKRISDILGDCSIPFIYEKIGSRYKHFFIDEFQDTSILQWHNFLPLVNNGLSEGNMSLLVGDAKQAIYRFRSGEVEQIMNLPSIYAAEENDFYTECENTLRNSLYKESLRYNYRSKKNVIDFNNSFFKLSKHKLTSENYRKVYDGMEQLCNKKDGYEGYVSVEIFDMDKFSEDTEKPTKLYKDAVKQSMLNDIRTLRDKGFRLSDIAVLVRNNHDGSDIADFLSKNNIPVMSSDSIMLNSSDKVRLIIYTLRYLQDDKNDVAKLSLSFYRNICAGAEPYNIQKALKDSANLEEIQELRYKSYSLYDLCCAIIDKYNFNIIEDEFLQYFMNHVSEWQNTENKGVDAFLEHWDKKSASLNLKINSDIDAVSIMTIHKSKGLEFKAVMYPYAYTKVPGDFKGGEKWLPTKDFEIFKDMPGIDSFVLPINKDTLQGTVLESHYSDEVEKAAFDDFNIMYVAMTRAKNLLFVYTNSEGAETEGSYNFFVDYFNAEEGNNADFVEEEDITLIKDRFVRNNSAISEKYVLGDILFVEDKKAKEQNNIIELDYGNIPQTSEWKNSLDFEPDPTMFWAEDEGDYLPQEWGSLVHDILSKINTIEDVDNVLSFYVNEGSIDKHQAEILHKQFEKIVEVKEIKAAYSKEAVIRNEMDILIHDKYNGNAIVRPDRYAELDDKVILIDYKTGKHHEKYYEQLQSYMLALKDMGIKKEIEAYLLYIGENIEIKPVFLDRLF